jgi:hypoxanthine phosphoribosyltransferase
VKEIIVIGDKEFVLLHTRKQIKRTVQNIAARMNIDFKKKDPVFLVVLDGAAFFAMDLLKKIKIPCEISFLKVSSYKGAMKTTGKVEFIFPLQKDVSNRHVIILEDIVDSGNTIKALIKMLETKSPLSISTAALLVSSKTTSMTDYFGSFNKSFVVGYGLDYQNRGRNLKHIYKLKEEP